MTDREKILIAINKEDDDRGLVVCAKCSGVMSFKKVRPISGHCKSCGLSVTADEKDYHVGGVLYYHSSGSFGPSDD